MGIQSIIVRRIGPRARALVMVCGVFGLAAGLALEASPSAGNLAARYLLFGATTTVVMRLVGSGRRTLALPRDWKRYAAVSVALLCFAAWSSAGWTIATMVGAAAEEWVFRRELPTVLSGMLSPRAGPAAAGFAGVTIAQLVFAACHLVSGPAASLVSFARYAAAGGCLAVIYARSPSLLWPIAVHFVVNESVYARAV